MSIKTHYIEFRNALNKDETDKSQKEFEKAYNEAFRIFQRKLTNKEKFDENNDEERYALIVLTDNLIGYWAENRVDEGIALAENLLEMTDSNKLKEMFKGYSLGMQAGINLKEFINKYVDLNKVDEEFPEFLCNFKKEIKELI